MDEFSKLYSLYYTDIYSYIFKLSKDKYISEDIVQETFIKVYEYIIAEKPIFNKSWLYRVSYNLLIDKFRKTKLLDYNLDADEHKAIDCIPHEEFEKKEEKEKIQVILDLLPHVFKNVLILREYKELSYEEIGEVLNMSVPNVKSNIFRARQKFRNLYKRMEDNK